MDYTRLYEGDEVIYQGTTCSLRSVIKGNTYVIHKEARKKSYGIIIDENGSEKLVKMGFNFAKIGGI